MQQSRGHCLDPLHIPQKPQQEIYRVNPLIHERAAAIEIPSAAPSRFAVVVRRTIPLQSRIRQQDAAQSSILDDLLQKSNLGFEVILENDPQFYIGFLTRSNQCGRLLDRYGDRLFNQYMKALLRGRDALPGMKP